MDPCRSMVSGKGTRAPSMPRSLLCGRGKLAAMRHHYMLRPNAWGQQWSREPCHTETTDEIILGANE